MWVRVEHDGQARYGWLDGGRLDGGRLDADVVALHDGDPFAGAVATGETLPLSDLRLLTPCVPSKMICLWNNFHALAAKLEVPVPPEPLYFLKAPSAFLAHGETIHRPARYDGPVVYEGELGIVIGKTCRAVSEAEAGERIFGYTCVNDVTAAKIITKDPTFPQWARAKSYDGFGVFGPGILPVEEAGGGPSDWSIRTLLNGDERQNYPVADMVFPPARLVSLLSHDMTLLPGDVIACGTSVGVGSMKAPENLVEVSVGPIGPLSNRFVQ